MIKKLLLTALLVFSANAFAQISSFPASESFDAVFTEGTDVAFIPNLTGNTVNPTATATRIFRDETTYFSAPAALSIIPTSGFTGDVRVSLNMTTASSLAFLFQSKIDVKRRRNRNKRCCFEHGNINRRRYYMDWHSGCSFTSKC
ncbi:hypothetical protein [Flavobacterium sp. 3HN19-14]|uniref:hypothetical protein n=1 Tax=Flavobacterium sp. 3HN19-14 TaxID=3448133 RepID=UPI003EDE9F0E